MQRALRGDSGEVTGEKARALDGGGGREVEQPEREQSVTLSRREVAVHHLLDHQRRHQLERGAGQDAPHDNGQQPRPRTEDQEQLAIGRRVLDPAARRCRARHHGSGHAGAPRTAVTVPGEVAVPGSTKA